MICSVCSSKHKHISEQQLTLIIVRLNYSRLRNRYEQAMNTVSRITLLHYVSEEADNIVYFRYYNKSFTDLSSLSIKNQHCPLCRPYRFLNSLETEINLQ